MLLLYLFIVPATHHTPLQQPHPFCLPTCICCTSAVASGRRSRPLTLRRPVPKHTPQTRTPRP